MKKNNVTKLKKSKKTAKKSKTDIIELILEDHKPLKRLIKVLKSEKSLSEKRAAFEDFAPLLAAHAKPEEQSLYVHMKDEDELRSEAFEGDTEHEIADRLMAEVSEETDDDVWEAKAKVLAELPDVRKEIELAEREEIGQEYLRLRSEQGAEEERLAS